MGTNYYLHKPLTNICLGAIEAARLREKEGELEVDNLPLVSHARGGGGTYVATWLWIPDDEIDADEEEAP